MLPWGLILISASVRLEFERSLHDHGGFLWLLVGLLIIGELSPQCTLMAKWALELMAIFESWERSGERKLLWDWELADSMDQLACSPVARSGFLLCYCSIYKFTFANGSKSLHFSTLERCGDHVIRSICKGGYIFERSVDERQWRLTYKRQHRSVRIIMNDGLVWGTWCSYYCVNVASVVAKVRLDLWLQLLVWCRLRPHISYIIQSIDITAIYNYFMRI